jgi:hypothetical protein
MAKHPWSIPVALIAGVLALFAAFSWLVLSHGGPFRDWETGAQFGNAFGALAALFSALAFAGLIITILMQREELRLQRKELALQRQELADTRQVLNEQRKQLASQADSAQKQVFEETFFRLVESLRNLVSSTRVHDHTGIMAMHMIAIWFRDFDTATLQSRTLTPPDFAPIFRKWFPDFRPQLAPYFDSFGMTVEFVVKSDRPDKIFYMDILRAALSPGELCLIFHYVVYCAEMGQPRLKNLCEHFGVLENFDPEVYQISAERRSWFNARREPRDYTSRS